MSDRRKHEIITFKVDESLWEQLQGIPNRSEFIRSALLAAMQNTCPLCSGNGTLSPRQREHWDAFARTHQVVQCKDCHELHITCNQARRRT